jgi:hypothetical protein
MSLYQSVIPTSTEKARISITDLVDPDRSAVAAAVDESLLEHDAHEHEKRPEYLLQISLI